jgi:hypothetical protein
LLVQEPPFAASDAPELVGTAVAFHYINRMVSLFLGEPIIPGSRGIIARSIRKIIGATFGQRLVTCAPTPGTSLHLLPDAALPPDLSWSASNPTVTGALARAARVAEEVGCTSLPESVRDQVVRRIGAWRGESPGLSRAWLAPEIASLRAEEQPLAALALLTAIAPYQVDEATIDAFRAELPSDEQLLGAAGWAAFAAATHVSTWLVGPSSYRGEMKHE